MKFFNVPAIEEDEHLYSYFLRTGIANGFSFKDLFALSSHYGKAAYPYGGDYETIFGYTRLYEFFDYDENDGNYESLVSLFKRTSIYNGIAPFTTKNKLKNKIEKLNKYNFSSGNTGPEYKVLELKLCPECMNDEIKSKGYFYYHRAHQMPEVAVCHKHNCELKKYNGPLGEELTFPIDLVDVETNPEISDNYKYAIFCRDVLDNHYQPIDGYFQIYDVLRKISNENKKNQISKTKLYRIRDTKLLIFCFNLFKTYDNLLINTFDDKRNLSSFDLTEKMSNYIAEHNDEYEYVASYNENSFRNEDARLAVIHHKSCNTQFIVRVVDFLGGNDCPYCNSLLTKEQRAKKEFDSLIGDKELLELYILPSDSNYDNYDVHQLGEFSFKGFSKRKNSGSDYAIIQHQTCGYEFEKKLDSFYHSPWCPICHKRDAILTHEDFVSEVKNLVGDEYIVLDTYKGSTKKNKFKHVECGTISNISPNNFFNGQRCKKCKRDISTADFARYVKELSYGRYKCVDIDTERVSIKDEQTGRVINTTRKKALQELTRYDCNSEILPLDKRNNNVDFCKSQYDIFYSRLCQKYGKTDLFFADKNNELSDLTIGLTARLGNLLVQLRKKQMVFRVGNHVYSLSPVQLTDEELLIEKYICRNGNQIGYYKGESFAYDVGLIAEKPDYISLCYNKEAGKCGRMITAFGIKVKLYSTSADVDNDNWPIIATMDFLKRAKYNGFNYNELGPLKQWLIEKEIKYEDFEDYYQHFKPWIRGAVKRLYEEN